MADQDQRITLREYIDSQLTAIHRDLERVVASIEAQRQDHQLEHVKDANSNEVRMKEHQGSHDREHSMRDLRDKENDEKLNIRLQGMNEIREQLNTQAATFMRQESADAKFTAMADRIANMEKWRAQVEGRGGGASQTIVWIFAGLSALATVVGLVAIFGGGR